jgi:type IV pilus modification protein PilV
MFFYRLIARRLNQPKICESFVFPASVKGFASRTGFTLIEVLMTVAVIAFGCLAAIQMQVTAIRGTATADNLTVATFLAESEMERLKSLSWADLQAEAANGDATEDKLDRNGFGCETGTDCAGHMFSRTIRYYRRQPTTMSTQVEVEINWRDSSGKHDVLYTAAMTSLSF